MSLDARHAAREVVRRPRVEHAPDAANNARLPTGTVTFLFTDLEGSTQLWDHDPNAARTALARHDDLIEVLVASHSGVLVRPRGEGDSRFAVFHTGSDAVAAACAIQRAFIAESWPTITPLRLRIAVHTGEAGVRDGDYYGGAVNRCARLRSIAHGGQTLLSGVTADIVRAELPDDMALFDLGMHRLKDLSAAEHVYQLIHPTLPKGFPPLRSLTTQLHNLPVQLSSFVGREREVEHVADLLGTSRHITLTGAGGVGKTRLALQVAAEVMGDYADGVWVVDLAPVSDAALVSQTTAYALGIREQHGHPWTQRLIEFLRAKELLLVLDNCEHLIGACAEFVETLLSACCAVKVIATSRERLAINGEIVWRVPSLDVPHSSERSLDAIASCAAVRLFVDRAHAVESNLQLTDSNAADIGQICARLDGIPLALELAAARVQVLSPAQLATRLSDSLRLLVPSNRTGPSRQQTLSATIQWSYNLLSPAERLLLARLSVFTGRFSLEAVEAICSGTGIPSEDVLRLLTRLVEQSLVVVEPTYFDSVRYRLLETIRQYALERFNDESDADAIFARHASFYLALAEEADMELRGPHQREWLDRIESEHDNMRAALRWSSESEQWETELRLAVALSRFWRTRGYLTEGRGWLSAALSRCADLPIDKRARALERVGSLAAEQADWDAAESYQLESLRIYRELDDKQGIATVLSPLAFIARHRGDRVRSRLLYEEMLSIARELEAKRLIAVGLTNVSAVYIENGELDLASKASEEAITLHRQLGNREGLGYCMHRLAGIAWFRGDYVAMRVRAEEAVVVFRELGHKMGVAWSLLYVGIEAYETVDFHRALAALEESLALARKLEANQRIAQALEWLGAISLAEGDLSSARERLEEGLAYARDVRENHVLIGPMCRLAQTAWAQDDSGRAVALFDECLQCLGEATDRHLFPMPLERIAALIATLGQPLSAAQLFGAADALRQSLSMPLPPVDKPNYSRAVANARAAAGRTAFEREWSDGATMTIDQAVAFGRKTLAALQSQTAREPARTLRAAHLRDPLDPLTAREREVAELLACGSTNREIAASLCIAPSTAERHVANILTKLGIRSRTEVAVWVLQQQQRQSL